MTLQVWQHEAKENYCNFASFNKIVDKTIIIKMGPNILNDGVVDMFVARNTEADCGAEIFSLHDRCRYSSMTLFC